MNDHDLARVVNGYAECALWTNVCRGQVNHDNCFGEDCDASLRDIGYAELDAFSPESIANIREQVGAFVATAEETWPGVFDDMEPEQVGHDFSLTRDGHGTGFWDRGLGERGRQLTELCEPYGEAFVEIGDDGIAYHHG